MALLHVDFFSDVLGMCTASMDVILAEKTTVGQIGMEGHGSDGTCPTLYLLHGMSDDHTIWQRRTSIERYAVGIGNLAVVMPTTHLGWYTGPMDMGYGYCDVHFRRSCLRICRALLPADERPPGGHLRRGTVHGRLWRDEVRPAALRETFSCCASLSGALDIADYLRARPA